MDAANQNMSGVAPDNATRKLEWSPDQIARFWDHRSTRDSQDSYFALQVGLAVTNVVEHVRPLDGLEVLDFGSGPGHLIPHLLDRGARVSAADHSPSSVEEVNNRFATHRNWGAASVCDGHRMPFDDNSFDAVFCLETIEHLHDDDCAAIFAELLRVLRPGGFALYTTPNEEDLEQHYVYCPSCDCEFHRMQHLRSWSAPQLTERLGSHGYEIPFCTGLDLFNFQPRKKKWRFKTIRKSVKNLILGTLDRLIPKPFPKQRMLTRKVNARHRRNLIAIATKPVSASNVTAKAA